MNDSQRDDGGWAFPGMTWVTHDNKANPEGMTLRDYFAAKILPAIWEDSSTLDECRRITGIKDWDGEQHFPTYAAMKAYLVADAMLKARKT